MSFAKRAVAGGLALTIAFAAVPATTALADPASELSAAQERLGSLGSELGALEDELSALTSDLERTDNEMWRTQENIKDTEARLAEAKELLSARMRSGYKTGGFNLIEFLFSSVSLEDLSSRLYYMDKIVDRDEAVIADVRTLENELEDEMSQLQAQHDDQQARIEVVKEQVGEYNLLVSEARDYYEQLDEQVRQQLEAETAAAAAASQSISTAVSAITEQQTSEAVTGATEAVAVAEEQTQPTDPVVVEPVQEPTQEEEEPAQPEPEPEPEVEPEVEEPVEEPQTGGDCYPGGGVSSAYSCIGWPYVWGGFGPSMGGFDCSGLVSYCYGDGSWRAGAEPLGLAIQAAGLWKDGMDNLSYGDLVFTDSEFNHVGIYIGGGMMIHAPTFGRTVSIDYVWSCYGGGPFVYPY